MPAEAMLLGKPVISDRLVRYGGIHRRRDRACRSATRLVEAVDPRGVFQAPGAVWAEPDTKQASAALAAI